MSASTRRKSPQTKAAPPKPQERAGKLTTIGIPFELLDRLRDISHAWTKAEGRRVPPHEIVTRALDAAGF